MLQTGEESLHALKPILGALVAKGVKEIAGRGIGVCRIAGIIGLVHCFAGASRGI
jgi:hypothetical protein